MNNQKSQVFVNGTSALKFQNNGEWGTIIEFPEHRIYNNRESHTMRQRMINSIGQENYRNLMGAEIVCSRIKVAAGAAFMFLGAVGTVFLEAFI